MDQVLERLFPKEVHGRLAYLSGPSFAAEVASQLPTAVTIASRVSEGSPRMQAISLATYTFCK